MKLTQLTWLSDSNASFQSRLAIINLLGKKRAAFWPAFKETLHYPSTTFPNFDINQGHPEARETERLEEWELPQNKTREMWTAFSPCSEPTISKLWQFSKKQTKTDSTSTSFQGRVHFPSTSCLSIDSPNSCPKIREGKPLQKAQEKWTEILPVLSSNFKNQAVSKDSAKLDSISTCFYQGVRSLWSSFPKIASSRFMIRRVNFKKRDRVSRCFDDSFEESNCLQKSEGEDRQYFPSFAQAFEPQSWQIELLFEPWIWKIKMPHNILGIWRGFMVKSGKTLGKVMDSNSPHFEPQVWQTQWQF